MAETKKRVKGKTTGAGGVPSAKAGSSPTSESGEVVKFDEAGMPTLDVWLEDETVWLMQAQMAELFGCAIANVNMHLNHIYADDELDETATIKDFLIVRFEGKHRVSRRRLPKGGVGMKIKEEDPMLEEIYATRRKISGRCVNDPKRYMAGIRDIQRRATEVGLSFLAYCQAAIGTDLFQPVS